MVNVKRNLIGEVFGRLTVIEQVDDYVSPSGRHTARWLCKCSCEDNKYIKVTGTHLIGHQTNSCGCLKREKDIEKILLQKDKNHKLNQYDLSGEYGVGWTSNTNKEFYFDIEDYDKIKDYCWYEVCANDYHYVQAHKPLCRENITMHTLLVNYDLCDHINRNPLDNRKENLRPATYTENAQNHSLRKDNTSSVTGVSWHKRDLIWEVYIGVNDKSIYIGRFNDKIDAIKARLKAELEYFGKEFAPQRNLFKQYGIKMTED
jgi:hypothetical protein